MHSLSFNQSYELCSPFALIGVMLSLCLNHVAIVASLFRSSVFHFLAKLFFTREEKTMKLSLLHKNVNTSSHIKGNLMALTAVFSLRYD